MKNIKNIVIIFCLLFLITTSIKAAQLPRFLGAERKFRSYVYNPNDVYRYIGHYNYQGFIEFDANESIATISMGDPTLWLFEHLGNRLFLKPVGEYNSQTNMTVITNKKVYHFELMAREADSISDENLIFVVKFIYPEEEDKNIVQFSSKAASDEPDLRNLSQYNFGYEYTGDANIAPAKVFDNGKFTYFQFTEMNTEIPAIFSVDANGFESLVNFRSAGNYIVVESIASQFTLRSGKEIVCVYNMSRYSSGSLRESSLVSSRGNKNISPAMIAPGNPNVQSMDNMNMMMPNAAMPQRVPNPAGFSAPIMPPMQ